MVVKVSSSMEVTIKKKCKIDNALIRLGLVCGIS